MIKIFNKGRKRRFLIFGLINLIITILFLQLFLLILPIFFSTLLSQAINILIGFVVYGKKVFKVKRLKKENASKYIFLAIFLWLTNWYGIIFLLNFLLNRYICALIMVPIQVLISYCGQRFYVFKDQIV
tara:strand:+ start:155 stop:541 length:387 start_codon:yes stop_codon:yes gene_type:complete